MNKASASEPALASETKTLF